MSTTEGWVSIMHMGVDSVGPDKEPIPDNKPAWTYFFIAFILFGSLFIMNLFVGVVIDTFNKEGVKLGKNELLTPRQREWVQAQLTSYQSKPISRRVKEYASRLRTACSFVESSPYFEFTILACIIGNTIALAINWYDISEETQTLLTNINYGFAGIFTLEAVFKLYCLGMKDYFSDWWNVFDLFIVLGTYASLIIGFAVGNSNLGT